VLVRKLRLPFGGPSIDVEAPSVARTSQLIVTSASHRRPRAAAPSAPH
jgi:hypothetical protein